MNEQILSDTITKMIKSHNTIQQKCLDAKSKANEIGLKIYELANDCDVYSVGMIVEKMEGIFTDSKYKLEFGSYDDAVAKIVYTKCYDDIQSELDPLIESYNEYSIAAETFEDEALKTFSCPLLSLLRAEKVHPLEINSIINRMLSSREHQFYIMAGMEIDGDYEWIWNRKVEF